MNDPDIRQIINPIYVRLYRAGAPPLVAGRLAIDLVISMLQTTQTITTMDAMVQDRLSTLDQIIDDNHRLLKRMNFILRLNVVFIFLSLVYCLLLIVRFL